MVCTICTRHQELADRNSTFVTGNTSYRIENIKAHFTSPEHLQCQVADQVQARIQQSQCAGPLDQLHENLGKMHIEERDAQSSDSLKVNITVQGGNVFAPILNKLQGAGDITFTQSVAGTNVSKSETRDVTAVITEYKESVVSMYAYTREYTSLAGEQVLLADRYVDPLIIPQHRIKKEREKEMRFKGNDFFNLKTYDINQSISALNLFSQKHGPNNDCPKTVILQGNSGSGKSFITQKIMLDWAKGNLFAGIFDLVFHLRCADLNLISEKNSLVELLNCSDEIIPILKDKQKRILFLVDGFDELRCSLPGRPLPATVYAKAEPGVILSSLLRGTMLKDAFLLVTTRSTSTEQLGKLLKCPQRFTEIMGFSEKGVEEYFLKFFKDTDFSKQVHEQVKTHETLYTACFSPVMCWLICIVFKQKSNICTRLTSKFKSTTSVFIDFVFILLEHHSQDLNQSEKFSLLKQLGQLAEDGMRNRRILFKRQVVPDMILNLTGFPFLCSFLHRKGVHMEEMFSFMHLSFQEFFAALFYILLDNTEAETKIKQLLSSVYGQFGICINLHLFPVIQFLFGLSNKKIITFVNKKHEVSPKIGSLLEEWMLTFVKSNRGALFSSFPFHCLNEVHENIVRNIMENWEKTKSGVKIKLSSSQMLEYDEAAYCLQFCRHIRSLHLHASTVQTLQIMEAVLNKCSKIHLTVDHVSDNDVNALVSRMEKAKYLPCLRIKDGSLSEDSVQMIMSKLSEKGSLKEVQLPVKTINYNHTEILLNCHKRLKDSGFFSLRVAPLMNREESLCDIFSIEHLEDYRIAIQHFDSSVKCELGLMYLSVASNPVISNDDLKNLLEITYNQNKMPSFSFDEQMRTLFLVLKSMPSLKEVTFLFRSLPETWAADEVIHFLQTCSSSFFELNVGSDNETLGKIRGEAFRVFNKMSILYFGCCHVDYEDYNGCTQSPSYVLDDVDRVPPCMSLIMTNHTDFYDASWAKFFPHYNKLKTMTEFCPEYDQHLDKVLDHMNTIPALNELNLALRFLTVGGAFSILNLFYTSSTLWIIGVMLSRPKRKELAVEHTVRGDRKSSGSSDETDEEDNGDTVYLPKQPSLNPDMENYDQNLCSELLVWKDSKTTYKLSLKCNGFSPKTKTVFGNILITVSKGVMELTWRSFFQAFYETKGLTQRDPSFDEKTNALLSFLCDVPELEEVEFGIHSLNENCAPRIIFYCHQNPNIRIIRLSLENDEQNAKDRSCSLIIERNSRDSMATVKIHMQSNTPKQSQIQFKLPCSVFCNLDVPSLLYRLRCLNGLNYISQEYDVQKNELISFLHSVPELQMSWDMN